MRSMMESYQWKKNIWNGMKEMVDHEKAKTVFLIFQPEMAMAKK